jgi:hypothetical protein
MELITKRGLIQSVAERYRQAHTRRGQWLPGMDGRQPEEVYAQLQALPAGASEADVAAIIGDDRYTANICDECHQDREVVVLMAIEIHHPTDSVAICPICLGQAQRLIQEAQ